VGLKGRTVAAPIMARSIRWSPVVALLLSGFACAADSAPWTAHEILRDVEPELQRFDGVTQPIEEADILMWQIERDPTRHFVVEELLLLTRSDTPQQGKRWALVHAFRHPSNDNTWHRSVSYIESKDEALVPHSRLGYRQFSTQPTATDVCAFLLHVRGLGVDSGFDHTAGDFPKATWRRLTGADAPCSFSGKVTD
jgi:hypothetical protein